jgi:ribosomal protein L24E
MKKKEMVEMTITYCDWCKEKISDYSHISVRKEDGTELDFHEKKCIESYTKSIKPKQR